MPHAVFLDRFFINRTRRPRFRGYFRYMGNFLEKSKPRLIDDRGKMPHTGNLLEAKNFVEENCLLREKSSTKKRRSRIFHLYGKFPRPPSVGLTSIKPSSLVREGEGGIGHGDHGDQQGVDDGRRPDAVGAAVQLQRVTLQGGDGSLTVLNFGVIMNMFIKS